MSVNKRVFYAVQAVGFAPLGVTITTPSGYKAAKGVQAVGSNVNFEIERINELGQLSIYEIVENLPKVEVTVDKVIDGYTLLSQLATPTATSNTLIGRFSDNQCMMAIAYYSGSQENATGIPLTAVLMSGLYVQGITWNIPVQGNITESLTLVCNDRYWIKPVSTDPWSSGTTFTGSDAPITAGSAGGVQRRENVVMLNSTWPLDIPGIGATGTNPQLADGTYTVHIQNVNISLNLGRTELLELGHKGPFYRFAEFPVEVNTTIEILPDENLDFVNAYSNQDNLTNRGIRIVLSQGNVIDLGTKNKLVSVRTDNGGTQGGNVTTTYSYRNYNDFIVT